MNYFKKILFTIIVVNLIHLNELCVNNIIKTEPQHARKIVQIHKKNNKHTILENH